MYWLIYFFINYLFIYLLPILAYESMKCQRGCDTWQVTAKLAQPCIFFMKSYERLVNCAISSQNFSNHYMIYTILYLYLFHAGIDNARNATKIRKALLSMQEQHLACRVSYILLPPKYLIIGVYQLRYINNNLPKIDVPNLWIWLLYFLTDHLCILAIYCLYKKHSTEFEMIDIQNSSIAYVVMYRLITYWFSD